MRSLARFLSIFIWGISMVGADYPRPWQMHFQEAASPVMEKIVSLHNLLLTIIISIAVFVGLLLIYVIYRFNEKKNKVPSKTSHNTLLEIFWTAIPVAILGVIAVPSFKLLYFMDKTHNPEMTLKITGHQWYWEYEYPDHGINFDSYMVTKDKLQPGQIRQLDVDREIVLPVNTNVRILVTSADVLHSWAVPSFGIKQDTVPGRLRETWVRINKEGKYYGQCSELCGQGHGFMPIAVKAISKDDFARWLSDEKATNTKTAPKAEMKPVAAQGSDVTKAPESKDPKGDVKPAVVQESQGSQPAASVVKKS